MSHKKNQKFNRHAKFVAIKSAVEREMRQTVFVDRALPRTQLGSLRRSQTLKSSEERVTHSPFLFPRRLRLLSLTSYSSSIQTLATPLVVVLHGITITAVTSPLTLSYLRNPINSCPLAARYPRCR